MVLLFFTLSGALLYFSINYRVYLNENTFAVLFESNRDEVAGYVGPELVLYTLGGLAIGVLIAMRFHRRHRGSPRAPRLKMFALLGTLFGVVTFAEMLWAQPLFFSFKHTFHTLMPISLLQKPTVYLREQRYLSQLVTNRRDVAVTATRTAPTSDGTTMVLVIGETARADHLHINGYSRQTTPKVEQLGMLSFPDAWACANGTRLAVPCLMTRATPESMYVTQQEKSLVSVFRRQGFDTYWISNQGYFWSDFKHLEFSITTIYAISLEAEHVTYVNHTGDTDYLAVYDEQLLPDFDRALQAASKDKLIVLHTVGSHWHCDAHYPPEFARYAPRCTQRNPQRCTTQQVVNSYDNSILHTDHFLSQVVERLNGRNAFMLYVSDHGEELGEEGVFTHTPESHNNAVLHVPLLVWTSDAYRASHPQVHDHMQSRAGSKVSHDWVFHSLLDCAGVVGDDIDPHLSLCR